MVNWKNAVRRFLMEDVGWGDVTTRAVVPPRQATAILFTKEKCVVAGLREAVEAFQILGATADPVVEDGAVVKARTTVLTAKGEAWALLAAERTALNLLMRMSGIATATADLSKRVRRVNPQARVAATRKTAPGLREFDKRAVELGGGFSHRQGLFDGILIKDNHLKLIDLEKAIQRAKRTGLSVEIEVESVEDAVLAAKQGAESILLDNLTPALAKEAWTAVKRVAPKTLVEISGGITAANISKYAKWANVLSVGALTHSVKAVDFSMEIEPA